MIFNTRCKICDSILLQHIDLVTGYNKYICVNCEGFEPTNSNIINASPYTLTPIQEQENKLEEQQPHLYYNTSGELLNEETQKLYRKVLYHEKQEQQIKQIIEAIPKETINNISAALEKKHVAITIDWSDIIGYDEIKYTIEQSLNSINKKRTHILIIGEAGTSKTVFLLTMLESLKKQNINVHYLDATTLSSAGVIDYLFSNNVEICLLDEIDKLEKEHQRVFLNMLEIGVLMETKGKKNGIRQKNVENMQVFATGNYMEKLYNPLLTRFMLFEIPAYTKEEFITIGTKLLQGKKYGKSEQLANYISSQIWEIYTSRSKKPNLRYARQVAEITPNDIHKVDKVLSALKKYSNKVDVE
ncbi:MAG: AAA family ATPase [Nitrososphaeraceae archaeon]